MNSSLAALEQAIILIEETKGTDQELLVKLLPLTRQKVQEILNLWKEVKVDWNKT